MVKVGHVELAQASRHLATVGGGEELFQDFANLFFKFRIILIKTLNTFSDKSRVSMKPPLSPQHLVVLLTSLRRA